MNNIKILSLIFLAVLSIKYIGAQNNTSQNPRYLSLYIDNDLLAGRDRCFTGGLKLSWMSKTITQAEQKSWLNWIPFIKRPGPQRAISLSLSQHIYTPDDIAASDLIEDDRPYAGIIYLSLGVHSRTRDAQDFMERNQKMILGVATAVLLLFGVIGGCLYGFLWEYQTKRRGGRKVD